MKRLLIGMVHMYQKYISPLKKSPTCRFTPTCSEYMIEAIEIHGSIRGLGLGLWRILRCNPFNKHFGIDPVPPKK
ncbi:membrane protein insertion efficiency factor YidD [Culicoidibacter larvae]|uniref:Putative membrane protein insertion efficiency factor n=1 Tax=Culicoidibacter larvae TaxID=2579976 RepID=A0A5R8QFN4_9FIRM|nr:membrane protein insertion efficiency factor YidD [Culicoidibacter larvae]